ncbi:response regulator transcription factor [Burkholderia oklahomensis]|uniref:Bacterial regulatory s, luxR family protein n=1 Tax=Burkholderia oklahomensis TaxID=342113 RepID=A0AAI8BCN6_9BURK|nr:response regulator transcription factor [Burkholderia oklahomensis]AIO69806.1 bacterial regulatory s, luxR family protein [Burkholderia oklahomensis]AJX33867.1 bacterial regulatory s, luxR family protein [Burkholderia oklahomensis C6786]AOI38963.1 LuxR family transcriptional regulator [Burkholderia oklahomensis EO147]AOI48664.1 LuxR family transcriptional regulator [Burkholderia oklahomensis C6786]KUY47450.1 LuxR family transcriptional regulator [Burkholderia oklahomensis C6786]
MIKVAICDAHPVLRNGVRIALANAGGFEVVGEAGDGESTLALARATNAHVLTLGLVMPGTHGIELIKLIKIGNPSLRVFVLTMYSEETFAVQACRAGASGFVTKSDSNSELIAAIRKVALGGVYVSAAVAERLALSVHEQDRALPHQRLSGREFDVMCRLASGQPVRDIARTLYVSAKTVSTYRTHICEKMGVPHDAALVRYAIRHKLIEDFEPG